MGFGVGEVGAVDQLLAKRQDGVAEQFVLAGMVPVQRGRGDADLRRDRFHADGVVALRTERLGGCPGDLIFAILGPSAYYGGALLSRRRHRLTLARGFLPKNLPTSQNSH